jgi:hypothetical protein
MGYRFLLMLGFAFGLSGCLSHEARVTCVPDPVDQEGSTVIGSTTHHSPPGPPALTVDRSPLPRDVQLTAWRQSVTGGPLRRQEAVLRTPLPWWQRFPFDLAVDLMPLDITVAASATIDPQPLQPRTHADLDREAAAAGYASVPKATPQP